MKWGKGWRKLYQHPSHEWLLLPLSARGLGDEMIRVAEDDGRIFVGKDPVAGICKLLGAHPLERRRVKADLEALLEDGFCLTDGEFLLVRNLVVAQAAVTPSAERMRNHRAKQANIKPETNPEQTNDVPLQTNDKPTTYLCKPQDLSIGKDSTAGVTVTVDKTRSEETRTDKNDTNKPAAVDLPAPSEESRVSIVVPATQPANVDPGDVEPERPVVPEHEVFAHWRSTMASPRSVLDDKRKREIKAAIARHGVEDCKRAIDGCFMSDFHMNRPGGGNDRDKKFNSISVIFRNADQTEGFIDSAVAHERKLAAVQREKDDAEREKKRPWNEQMIHPLLRRLMEQQGAA